MKNKTVALFVTILSILPILFGTVLFVFFRLFRYIVGLRLKWKYGGRAQFLASNDAMFAEVAEDNNYVKHTAWTFKGRVDISVLRQRIADTITHKKNRDGSWKNPKCRLRLCREYGYCFWLPENNFRIEDHVKLYEGNQPQNQNDLLRIMAEYSNCVLPKDLSPWCVYAINLAEEYAELDPGPHFVLFFMDHHTLSDGISFMRVYSRNFFDKELKFDVFDRIVAKKLSYGSQLKQILKMLAFGVGTLILEMMNPPEKNILYGKPIKGRKLLGISSPIDLNRIKRVKDVTGTTVNDVIMTCVCGAFRSQFLKQRINNPPSLHYAIPVSLHNLKTDPTFLNQTSFVFFHDACDKPTAKERLLTTQKNMNDLKNSNSAFVNNIIFTPLLNTLPLWIFETIKRHINSTCTFSNMPGATAVGYFNRCELLQAAFFTQIANKIGFGISVLSYNGQVQVAVKIDAAFMDKQENVNEFLEDIVKEFEELEKIEAN